MIAGHLDDEQKEALARLRHHGQVRTHICKDEHQEHQRLPKRSMLALQPASAPAPAPKPPKGKRAVARARKPATEPRPALPAVWVPARPSYLPNRQRRFSKRLKGDGNGETAKIRAALRCAGPAGMSMREIRTKAGTASGPTGQMLFEMRDVLINRSPGRGRYRYRLAP